MLGLIFFWSEKGRRLDSRQDEELSCQGQATSSSQTTSSCRMARLRKYTATGLFVVLLKAFRIYIFGRLRIMPISSIKSFKGSVDAIGY